MFEILTLSIHTNEYKNENSRKESIRKYVFLAVLFWEVHLIATFSLHQHWKKIEWKCVTCPKHV